VRRPKKLKGTLEGYPAVLFLDFIPTADSFLPLFSSEKWNDHVQRTDDGKLPKEALNYR
jgi:hypothetical protein